MTNCPRCGTPWSDHTAACNPSATTLTPGIQYGWLCPRCGRGNAPALLTCPCHKEPLGGQGGTTFTFTKRTAP